MNAPLANDVALLAAGSVGQPPFAWIGDLMVFIRRNWRLQSACVGGAVIVALLYTLTATPRFTASATLLIDTRQTDLLRQRPLVSDAQIENAMIESQVEVLRSSGLARQVVERLDLADDPAFSARPSLLSRMVGPWHHSPLASIDRANDRSVTTDRLAQQLLSMINPHRIGLTYVIEVDATATSGALAARLANGLINAYVAGQIGDRTSANRQASGWLEGRLAEARDKALRADQAVQAFKAKNGIVDTGHGTLDDQQITELSSQLVAAQGKTAVARARLDRIRQAVGSGSAKATVSEALTSPVINNLRERYLNDALRVTEWSARFGPDHRAAVSLRKEMASLQASIGSEMGRIERTAGSDLEVALASQAALRTQLDAMVTRSASSNMDRATLRSLQSAADAYRALYSGFLQRAVQSTQDESFPVADARVITPARPPLSKSKPQGKLILLASIVAGLGFGFGLSLVREALDRRLRSAADLETQTGLACLATLPETSILPEPPGLDPAASSPVVTYPDTLFSLGIQRLQLRVQPPAATGRGRLIGLVSLAHGAGTSTIARHLVPSLAASGYSVTLLDLSGKRRQTPAQIRGQLEVLRRDHDVIVVDLPALSEPSQAHAVFSDITNLVLVVQAARTSAAALTDGLRIAGLDRRMLFGAVLTRVGAAG